MFLYPKSSLLFPTGLLVYEVCPEGIQPCTMKNRDNSWRRYKITLYIGQWRLSPLQSTHLGTSHSSPSISSTVENTLQNPLLEAPSAAPSYFLNLIDGLKSFPFQRWFEFREKPEVTGHQIWAVEGLSHLGDLMFCQKTLNGTWCMSWRIVVMKLPITSGP